MTSIDNESEEIDGAIFNLVKRLLRQKNAILIAPENELHYGHGETWAHVEADTGETNVGGFKEHSAEISIPGERIRANDHAVIIEFVQEMAEKMHGEFARSVYAMVGEAAAQVGNTATFRNSPDLPLEEQLLEIRRQFESMIERIEYGVDAVGAASAPSLHISPENTKMIEALNLPRTPKEQEQFDELIARKEAQAVGREAARLAKYAE